MNNHKTSQEQTNDRIKVDANVRPTRDCVRLLNIMIERKQTSDENFAEHVSYALREYADAIDKGVTRTCETFYLSGCEVKIIAGSLYY